jgi:hypothetical protein
MHSVSFRYMIKDVQESFGLSDAEVILLEQVRADSETGSVLVGQPKGQRERERDDKMTSERNEQRRSTSFSAWSAKRPEMNSPWCEWPTDVAE